MVREDYEQWESDGRTGSGRGSRSHRRLGRRLWSKRRCRYERSVGLQGGWGERDCYRERLG